MAQRSQRKLAAMRVERAETAAARRRRELREKYPDIPLQVWSNMGDGLMGGEGARVLRGWLGSLEQLVCTV